MWMWYLSGQRCLLLAPHGAMLSLHLPPSPILEPFSSNALILRGNQLVDQNNYCQYGHVYVCVWIITVIPPLRDGEREWSVWLERQRTQCGPWQTAHVRTQEGSHSETHTNTHTLRNTWSNTYTLQATFRPVRTWSTTDSAMASNCEATHGMTFDAVFLVHLYI